jgi:hypothetical protein
VGHSFLIVFCSNSPTKIIEFSFQRFRYFDDFRSRFVFIQFLCVSENNDGEIKNVALYLLLKINKVE